MVPAFLSVLFNAPSWFLINHLGLLFCLMWNLFYVRLNFQANSSCGPVFEQLKIPEVYAPIRRTRSPCLFDLPGPKEGIGYS